MVSLIRMRNQRSVRRTCAVFLLFSVIACRPESVPVPPEAAKGSMDLSAWDFEKDGLVSLAGEWEFHWMRLLPPGGAETGADSAFIKVPSQWQTQGYPAYGYATYRLRLRLPPREGLSIAMTHAATAYRMLINGKDRAANGVVGTSQEQSVPLMKHSRDPVLLPASVAEETELLLHVSNFHFFQAGLWSPIKLGTTKQVQQTLDQKFVLDLIVFSSLLTMGLYHLGLFFNRTKDSTPLFFAAFCILMAVRTVSLGERMILDAFPFIPFTLLHKVEFISFYYGAVLFTQYMETLFPVEFSRRIALILRIFYTSAAAVVLLFPMSIYGRTLVMVQGVILLSILYFVYVLVRALIYRRTGARLFLAGFLLFSLTMVVDILKTFGFFQTIPFLASYGFLSFIVFQAAVLSRRFARAFTQSEELAAELKVFSEGLEEKVKERTHELHATIKTIRHDLSVARAVQQNTLTLSSLEAGPISIVPAYLPMEEVGGDFYGATRISESRYRIFLADATGHGVQAALITMAIKGIYDNIKKFESPPNELLEIFNNEFVERYAPLKSFFTAMIVDVDTEQNRLQFASAGHPAALLLQSGSMELLEKTGRIIGIGSGAVYGLREASFSARDRLYLFTDGMFEEFNQNNEEFGEKRLHAILAEHSFASIEESIQKALAALNEFLGQRRRQDDATILGIGF